MDKPAETRRIWDVPLATLIAWDGEKALYVGLTLVALIARVYGLGWRAMSHDESLHALYSWQLYDGRGYEHNPMMHGPFLFHINTLFYFLFGVNDATARLSVAVLGTLMIPLCWGLRRWIGRVGALATAAMVTLSPSLLYYSRYIRNDVYIAFWLLVMLIAIFRYWEERRARWLYVTAAALAVSYATKEVAFLHTVILAGFLILVIVARLLREPWERPMDRVLCLGLLAAGGAATVFALYRAIKLEPGQASILLAVFVAGVALLAGGLYALWGGWGEQRLRALPEVDLLLWIVSLSLPLFSPFLIKLLGWDPQDYSSAALVRSGAVLAVMTLAAAALGWGWLRQRWLIGAGLFWAIALTLFTTFYTNGKGMATGVIGSLGYWMAQQDVQRGSQPWYYYLLVVPLYEFLPLFLSLGGALAVIAGVWRFAPRRAPQAEARTKRAPAGTVPLTASASGSGEATANPALSVPSLYVLFALWWTLASWGLYSWAGEKMPWLSVHIAFPMTVLGGWFVQRLWARVDGAAWRAAGWWKLALTLALLAFTLGPLAAFVRQIVGGQAFRDSSIAGLSATTQGILSLVVFVVLIYLGWGYAERLGARQSLLVAAAVVLVGLTAWTVRVTYLLNYVNYDLASEMLVYAHGTPDIKYVMNEIELLSRQTVGDKQIKVAYDDDSTWPLEWYLREYPNKAFYGASPSREALDAPVVIAGDKNDGRVKPFLGNKYLRYKYRLVWWPREDYKGLTWERLWQGALDAEKRRKFWDVVLYRRWDTPLTQWPYVHNFYLYVRRDIASQVWRFGASPAEVAAPVDPYEKGFREAAAIRQLGVTGASGSAPGQFQTPRNVAVAPDGRIVVADSGNHRIQVFDAQGNYVVGWGTSCDLYAPDRPGCVDPDGDGPQQLGDGQFREPWGVAVDANGIVYVADTWNHRIQKFTLDGQFLGKWGFFATTDGQLGQPIGMWGPRAIAFDAEGNVYVTDTGNKRVQKFDPQGNFVAQWGGGGVIEGYMDEPVGIATDAQGNFYVADTWNRRVQKFNAAFGYLKEWTISGWESQSIVNKPYLAVDAQANLVYVTDPEGYRVLVFDTEGTFRATFGQYGSDNKSFALPNGVAVDGQGNVYVADADNHRILVFARVE